MLRITSLNTKQFKNVSSLVGATAIAQLIHLGSTPIITRYFPPEEFAVFQLIFSLSSILAVISTFRYEIAVVTEEEDEKAKKLVIGSILIALVFGIVVFSVLSLINSYEIYEFDLTYLLLVPIYIIASGTSQTFHNYSIRERRFSLNFWSRIFSAFFQAFFAVLFGLVGALSLGLMVSVVIGQITSSLILLKSFKFSSESNSRLLNLNEIIQGLIKHRKFAQYNAPHSLIDVLQDQGVIFLLGLFFPGSLLAFYGQAYRLLKAPVGFIGAAIHQVYFPELTVRWQQGENLRPVIKRFYLTLFLFGLPFFAIAGWYSTSIFAWLLGTDWMPTGEIALILMPWIFLNFIASPVSSISVIASKQRLGMLIAVSELIFRFIAVIIGGMMNDFKLLLLMVSLIGCLFTIFKMIWYLQISKSDKFYLENNGIV